MDGLHVKDNTNELHVCNQEEITGLKEESLECNLQQEVIEDNRKEEPVNQTEVPTVSLKTQVESSSKWVLGISLLGRSHKEKETPCQDFHIYEDLGDGWNVFIISDGAGSARESHRGSRMTCNLMVRAIRKLLEKSQWKSQQDLPSDIDWYIEFSSICRGIKGMIEEQIETLDEPVSSKDFNATIQVLIVSPNGMLVGHIGDGRMGFQDNDGIWHSLIIPHKGEEANSTVFLMNRWDKPRIPAAKMSGVHIPETRVINSIPAKVVLMTDGCENFSWKCVAYNEEKGQYIDRNEPFESFLNPLFEKLDYLTGEEKLEKYSSLLNSANDACVTEQDDRTMLICNYGLQREKHMCPTEGQNNPTT